MKALELNAEKELNIVDLPKPTIMADEVLVRVKASALNHRELWISKGLYPGMRLPCILGADGAGRIEQVGADGNQELLGKEVIIYPAYDWGTSPHTSQKSFRVLGMPDPGTMAEYVALPERNVVIKPAYLSWTEAAAIPVAGLTAWRSLTRHGRIQKGDHVLITGIGGGVAQAGLLFAKQFGAKIFVTSGSQEKIDLAIQMGASGGVNYKDPDWNIQLKELSKGIDIVLDSSPAAQLDDYLKFLNMGARIVYYGSTGSRNTSLNMSKFFLRHISFIGTAMGSPDEFFEMIAFMEKYQLKPSIHAVYNLDQAIEAFHALAESKQVGKIVIEH